MIDILLVEDEVAHAELIRRAFEAQAGQMNLMIARSLQEAHDCLVESIPDLVITDLILPDGRGIELLPADKEEIAYPVVVMTSHGNEQVAVEAMKAGALDYVVKSEVTLLAMPHIAERALREWGYIIERKRAEEKIRLLSAAIDQTAEGVVITDTNGTILYVNPAFERITGYNQTEAIGQTPRMLKSGHHNAVFYQELWTTISSGNVWQGRSVNKKKDGSLYTEETNITPVRDENGAIINYVEIKRDVTHELKLEEQLHQSQKMEAVGQLAGGVAHDFNNMLQAILGYTHMAKSSLPLENPAQADLDYVLKAANRATSLVRQLLAFSRREALRPKHLDLNDVIINLLKMMQRLIGEHIDLEVHVQNGIDTIYADPGQIEQILLNLCVNARDAMPNGGQITIETENVHLDHYYAKSYPWAKEGDYVLLSVSDTGVGIPPEIRDRIFEPFFTTKQIGEGTGLGLATVYAITKQHDGLINVYSEPGHGGTTFRIYLPAIPGRKKSGTEEKNELPAAGGTETILLAEDDESVRDLVVQVLEQAGYRVLVAPDGEEALRLFRQQGETVDLVLLDTVMPKKGGRAVYDVIKSQRPHLPVLFSTGYGYNILKNGHLPKEGIQLLRKPYSPNELLGKVREMLE